MDSYEFIKAENLICPERFDLISKIKYVENKVQGLKLNFIKKYYLKTIEAFTEGTFIEEDGTELKKTAEDFLRIFDELIYDIKDNGVDPQRSLIPVNYEGILDDGAHRTAIAIYFKQSIPITYVQNKINFNYKFFRKRLLDEKILDWTATEYCKLRHNTYLVCIWPRADYEALYDQIYEFLEQQAKIVYEKKIKFSVTGFIYFIAQIYSHQDWVGNEKNHFLGAAEKARNCWDEKRKVLSFVIEAQSLERVVHIKEYIRGMFGIGNHSIHITDNQKETISIASLLYNKNSLDLMNYGEPDKYLQSSLKRKTFAQYIRKAGMSIDDFVVDSSSVLALYGLRDAEDIDYLYLHDSTELFDDKNIECHEEFLNQYSMSKNEMILNPENYLVYDGIKFITLNILLKFKKNRGEKKDIVDCKLIEDFMSQNKSIKTLLLKIRAKGMRILRNIRISILHLIKKVLVKLGIFERIKEILKR
ncbi:MAG: hypothetical protein J1E64_00325 [Acetatifactor sp.]|nr:hypothetical protein [Acetatifactor sp.]